MIQKLNKENFFWKNESVFCFTMDIDWASESAIEYACNLMEGCGIPFTAFITHYSEYLHKKMSHDMDVGIHPNFLLNSSQGNTIDEVVDFCMDLCPDAKSFRCHKYFDNNDITDKLTGKGFTYDSNLCTKIELIDPFLHRSGLIRFPIYLEDGAYLLHNCNLNFEEVIEKYFYKSGLMVIDIHPMHMVINTPEFQYTRKIKDGLTPQQWNKLKPENFKQLEYDGLGIRTFIINLLNYVKSNNIKAYTLKQLYDRLIE